MARLRDILRGQGLAVPLSILRHTFWKYSFELCQFRCTEEEISDVHIKVYYQRIAIIVFATCAIF